MDVPDSPLVEQLPEDLEREYRRLLAANRSELHAVPGLETLHNMLMERLVLVYAMMRYMERSWSDLDQQRYNQLLEAWLKIGQRLLDKYKEIYAAGALRDVFVDKIMTAVAEEVDDDDTLKRIRDRLNQARKEPVLEDAG